MTLYLKHLLAMINQKKTALANNNKILCEIINTTKDSLTIQILSSKHNG